MRRLLPSLRLSLFLLRQPTLCFTTHSSWTENNTTKGARIPRGLPDFRHSSIAPQSKQNINVVASAWRPGDWECSGCHTMNASMRQECYQCHRSVDPPELDPSNWRCGACGECNPSTRQACRRCFTLSTYKGPKKGAEWRCNQGNCKEWNHTKKMHCRLCGKEREDGRPKWACLGCGEDKNLESRGLCRRCLLPK